MKPKNPHQVSPLLEPVKEYAEQVRTAKDLEQLLQRLSLWQWVAGDALESAAKMKPSDWPEFQKYLKDVQDEAASAKIPEELHLKYISIPMPADMFKASMVSYQFKAPWGVAFNRLSSEGLLPSQSKS